MFKPFKIKLSAQEEGRALEDMDSLSLVLNQDQEFDFDLFDLSIGANREHSQELLQFYSTRFPNSFSRFIGEFNYAIGNDVLLSYLLAYYSDLASRLILREYKGFIRRSISDVELALNESEVIKNGFCYPVLDTSWGNRNGQIPSGEYYVSSNRSLRFSAMEIVTDCVEIDVSEEFEFTLRSLLYCVSHQSRLFVLSCDQLNDDSIQSLLESVWPKSLELPSTESDGIYKLDQFFSFHLNHDTDQPFCVESYLDSLSSYYGAVGDENHQSDLFNELDFSDLSLSLQVVIEWVKSKMAMLNFKRLHSKYGLIDTVNLLINELAAKASNNAQIQLCEIFNQIKFLNFDYAISMITDEVPFCNANTLCLSNVIPSGLVGSVRESLITYYEEGCRSCWYSPRDHRQMLKINETGDLFKSVALIKVLRNQISMCY